MLMSTTQDCDRELCALYDLVSCDSVHTNGNWTKQNAGGLDIKDIVCGRLVVLSGQPMHAPVYHKSSQAFLSFLYRRSSLACV